MQQIPDFFENVELPNTGLYKKNVFNHPGFYNFLGGGKKYSSYDQQQEKLYYASFKKQWPDTTDCNQLNNYSTEIQNEVLQQQAKLTQTTCDSGCKRVANRTLNALNQRLTEIQNNIVSNNCVAQNQSQSNAQFLNQTQQLLQSTNNPSGSTPSTLSSTLGSIGSALGLTPSTNQGNGTGTTNPAPSGMNPILKWGLIGVGGIIFIVLIAKMAKK